MILILIDGVENIDLKGVQSFIDVDSHSEQSCEWSQWRESDVRNTLELTHLVNTYTSKIKDGYQICS